MSPRDEDYPDPCPQSAAPFKPYKSSKATAASTAPAPVMSAFLARSEDTKLNGDGNGNITSFANPSAVLSLSRCCSQQEARPQIGQESGLREASAGRPANLGYR